MNICIFAGSSSKSDDSFSKEAAALGVEVARGGHTLLYGAGGIGLMGAAADAALNAGGKVTGVIPEFMVKEGWAHPGITKTYVTKDMGGRKAKLFELADAIISLPGGIGTLEELTEAMTLKQLGQFNGAIIILNYNGFYNKFLELLDHMAQNRFFRKEHMNMFRVATTAAEAVEMATENIGWIENPISKARI